MTRRAPLGIAVVLVATLFIAAVTPGYGQASLDYAIPNGWFYTQANGRAGEGGTGFAITDNDNVPMWTWYRRMGGVAALGYPISKRFMWDGYVSQATQKVVMQWRPDQNAVLFVNVFDKMTDQNKDPWLRTVRAVPNPVKLDETGKGWEDIKAGRLKLLDDNPAIKARYFAAAGDPIIMNGLPTSRIEDFGNVFVLRAQRIVIQQWKVDVPWAKAGEVQVANGGDVAKEAGLFPAAAIAPDPAGSPGGAPIAQNAAPAPTTAPAGQAATAPQPTATPGASAAQGGSPYPRQLDPQTRMQPSYLQETPGARWIVVKLHQLTACENSGNGVGYLETLDASGKPIDGVTIRTDSGPTSFTYVTGGKGPGRIEAYFYRGNWDAWVIKDETGAPTTSDVAKNMNTVLFAQTPEEQAARYCNGVERNTTNHYSYQVIFRKRG